MATKGSLVDAAAGFANAIVDEELDRLNRESKLEIEEGKNGEFSATSRSYSIRTLPQLLDAIELPRATADIDADTEFVVGQWKANVWEQGTKIGNKLISRPLWQVNATFKHRRPNPNLYPQPLVLNIPHRNPRKLAEPKPGKLARAFIMPDTQFGFWRDYRSGALNPFHDRKAIDCALQMMRDYAPDRLDLLGDVFDLPMFQKKFPVGPELRNLTQPAFVEAAFVLWKARCVLDQVGPGHRPITIIPGNHDQRLLKAMRDSGAEEASDLRPVFDPGGTPLVSIQRILQAEKLGVEFAGEYPDGRVIWNRNVWGMHGDKVGRGGGGTVRKYLTSSPSMSVVFGHVHRVEMAWATTHNMKGEREFMAWSPGCLCRIDGAVPSNQSRNDWQQGCGGLEYEPDGSSYFWPEQMRIQGGRGIYRGQVYQGQDYTEELIEWAKGVGWVNADHFAGKD